MALLLIFLFSLEQTGIASALSGQVQEGEFTNGLKVAGTGYFEVGVSVKDRDLALEYNSFMTGDGDLEMDTGTVESQRAGRLPGMDKHQRVTTRADFFEEHPGSTELWAPGSPLFPQVEDVASEDAVRDLGGRLDQVVGGGAS